MSNPKADKFYEDLKTWKPEVDLLRKIILEYGLYEDYKWRVPVYTVDNKNILAISPYKDGATLNFFKGVLLKDKKKVLIQPGENTQSGRFLKFQTMEEIELNKSLILEYVKEAVEIEEKGLKPDFKKTSDYEMPEELIDKLDENPEFKSAFEALTPGRQRGYILHFSGAKQSATRVARIEKYMDRIFDGKGILDCVCGHSKRYPNCDGTHKYHK